MKKIFSLDVSLPPTYVYVNIHDANIKRFEVVRRKENVLFEREPMLHWLVYIYILNFVSVAVSQPQNTIKKYVDCIN